MVIGFICEGCPYAPYQTAPTAYPKQKMMARIFSKPYASFSSFFDVIFSNPRVIIIWPIHPAEIIGEIPNYISVPLLDAIITLAQ